MVAPGISHENRYLVVLRRTESLHAGSLELQYGEPLARFDHDGYIGVAVMAWLC